MTSIKEDYALSWNGHANNFSNSFKDLLQQNEMVDVTLAADGYMINAHRLVLSALSPYFRQMFTQMPANQLAFVFMKDVSKRTLEDLIKFIYSGEVNVGQDGLEEFLSTAKALEIKGIADENASSSFDGQASESKWSMPAHTGFQYQSSRSMRVPNFFNSNSALSQSQYRQPPSHEYPKQEYFDIKDAEGMKEAKDEMGDSYENEYGYGLGIDNDDSPMDKFFNVEANQLDASYYDSNGNEKQTDTIAPKVKRAKRTQDIKQFNIVADIRKNVSGRDNLFYNGYKFTKNGKGDNRQVWQCTKRGSRRCKASASTIEIDGVVMMKDTLAEHSHQPNQ